MDCQLIQLATWISNFATGTSPLTLWLQKQEGNWRLIQAGSRFLSETEFRYSVIDMELTEVIWAMKKCHFYFLGLLHFTLGTDNQPLVPIMDKYSLEAVETPCLQRLKEHMSPFIFTTVWKKGK